ncbi:hypothetical protein EON68_01710 [archaeon]|nr:MAG: hypothetical protein EON68_01710 [archaeon]
MCAEAAEVEVMEAGTCPPVLNAAISSACCMRALAASRFTSMGELSASIALRLAASPSRGDSGVGG